MQKQHLDPAVCLFSELNYGLGKRGAFTRTHARAPHS